MRQWFWVLRGSAGINVEGRKDIARVEQYDAMCISAGLRHNVQELKSYEGADIAWVEEANNVSRTSWNTLTPPGGPDRY